MIWIAPLDHHTWSLNFIDIIEIDDSLYEKINFEEITPSQTGRRTEQNALGQKLGEKYLLLF